MKKQNNANIRVNVLQIRAINKINIILNDIYLET